MGLQKTLSSGLSYTDSTVFVTGAGISDAYFGTHLVSSMGGAAPATSSLVANLTSATFTGNDVRGIITLVVAAGGIAANSSLCTCTFQIPYSTTPKITLVNQTSAALANVSLYVVSQSTGVSFVLGNDQALVVGTYIVDYIVIG